MRKPFFAFEDGPTIAPAPRLIMRTVTPGGLFYPGIEHFGTGFATDLGHLFEHYVGRNLRLIEGAEVHPEISYGPGKGRKSVDWFVVTPSLVLLVECKLKRLGLAARAGDAALHEDLVLSIDKAYKQIGQSIENIAAEVPEFKHIPTDRPLLAMVVSAEPIYTASAYLVEQHGAAVSAGRLREVPVAAVSARELETLGTHGAETEDLLTQILHNHEPGNALGLRGVPVHGEKKNSILENAWNTYPFPPVASEEGPIDLPPAAPD